MLTSVKKQQQHNIVGTRSVSIQESKDDAVEYNQVVPHPTQPYELCLAVETSAVGAGEVLW